MELQWPLIIFTSPGCLVGGAVRDAGADGGVRRRQEGAGAGLGLLGRLAGGRRDRGVLPSRALGADLQRVRAPDERDHAGADRDRRAGGRRGRVSRAHAQVRRRRERAEVAGVAVRRAVGALVAVMAHSYTMAARPAWDSALWILYVLGNACVLGPATFLLLSALAAGDPGTSPPSAQPAPGPPRVSRPSPAPPSTPSRPSPSPPSSSSPPAPSPTSASTSTRRTPPGPWPTPRPPWARRPRSCGWEWWPSARSSPWPPPSWAGAPATGGSGPPVAIAAALVGAVCMRVVFYNLGLSVFMFY